MHVGSIDNPDTAAGRVYRVLKARMESGLNDGWIGGWDLGQFAKSTAVSTRVSEIRAQLFVDEGRRETIEVKQDGRYFFYRLVKTKGQLELAI